MTASEKKQLMANACKVRMGVIESTYGAKSGHPGGSLSASDLFTYLYFREMKVDPADPKWEERDRFVLSKGHTAPGLYAALALKGFFPWEELKTLRHIGSRLQGHPNMNETPGVDMSTGSLGQGMSTAIGIAHGNKMLGKDNYTYLLLGDGESQEGQVWEGALYAPQHKLSHLIAFLDYNHQQLDGYTKDICDLGDMRQKFQDFGWYALEVDGHDVDAIYDAIALAKHQQEKPTMIVLQTQKGKGCFFAEGIKYNHHMRFSKEQCEEAIARLEKEGC